MIILMGDQIYLYYLYIVFMLSSNQMMLSNNQKSHQVIQADIEPPSPAHRAPQTKKQNKKKDPWDPNQEHVVQHILKLQPH